MDSNDLVKRLEVSERFLPAVLSSLTPKVKYLILHLTKRSFVFIYLIISREGGNMRALSSIKKYIWFMLFLFIFITYSSPTFAQAPKKNKSNPIQQKKAEPTPAKAAEPATPVGGSEKIVGAFGIKFGENIKPYLEGHYSNKTWYVPDLTVPANTLTYKILKPPINVKDNFPDIQDAELLGISDENDLVLTLNFTGAWGSTSQICGKNSIGPVILEALREKYKIKKTISNNYGWQEEYGDDENNKVVFQCTGSSFSAKYTSHLMSDYIARLKGGQQTQKDEMKKSLKGF
jgi:hypothetical protein